MKNIIKRVRGMCGEARWMMRSGFMIAGALYIGALMFSIAADSAGFNTYYFYMNAKNLESIGLLTLFVTVFASAFLEERLGGGEK